MQLLRTQRPFLHIPRYLFQQLNDVTTLPEDTVMIQEAALAFAKEKFQPFAREWDQKHYFPVDSLREAAKQGYASIYTSVDYGGCGLDRLTASVIFEALSYGCIATTAYLTIHNMCSWMIDSFGSKDLKDKFLPRMATLELFSSYCLTEPNSGSDSKSLKTSAKKDGNDYIINGSKIFISGGSMSDVYLVMCRTGEKEVSSIIVEKGTKGLTYGKKEEKMGWRCSPTTMVMFEDVRVPQSNLIGKEGEGFKYAMKALDGGRINIASCSLGGASYAFDLASNYMTERKQFGQQLSALQHLQFKLADMGTSLVSSRLMVRNAARMIDIDHKDKTMYSAMAKRYATDTCFTIANDALQIHGGYGYLSEYPLERIVRDLRVHSILEGTNEIMRLIISRQLLNMASK